MKKIIPYIFVVGFLIYFAFLIRPAILGQLQGTFRSSEIPEEYVNLEKHLTSDKSFYRTFWIPSSQRFGYYSNTHPAINGNNYFEVNSPLDAIRELKKENNRGVFELSGIRYVIVPYDSKGEIFLKDRKYDEALYKKTIQELRTIDWLREMVGFGRLGVFENTNYKDHIWSPRAEIIKDFRMTNPTSYIVDLEDAKVGDVVVFSENYDAHWWAIPTDEDKFSNLQKGRLWGSNPYERTFNSFVVRRDGDYSVELFYFPQRWVEIGSAISLITLIAVGGAIFMLYRPNKWLKRLKNAKIRL